MTFKEAMAATSRELNARATITCVDAFVISNTPLVSFSVEEGGQMTLGSVVSSRYTVSLPNGGGEWLKNGSILGNRSLTGARVQIQIGVYHDGAWDWQNAGLFIVEKTSAPEFSTAMRLTGNDPLIMLDKFYDDQLAYRSTTTLGSILAHIKSKGITITGSLACNSSAIVNFQPDWGEEPTIREVLGYVLQMGGSFARCDRAGNITIAASNNAITHAVTTDKYMDFTDDERYFNFNRIKILPNGAKKDAAYVESYVTSAAESAANTLCLEGNPLFKTKTTTSYYKTSDTSIKNVRYYVRISNKYEVVPEPLETSLSSYYRARKSYNTTTLQSMANALKTALTGMSFRAITIRWRGDPTVLIGDKVTLTDTRGVSTTTVILQQSLRYENGFYSEIACPLDLTAVTPATLTSSGAWTPPYFGTGTIDGSVIMPDSLTGVQFADGSITNSQIKGGTITGTEIADSTIKNSHFQDGTISGSIFEDGTINASKIDNSTFTNGSISGTAIDTSTFTNGSISGTAIDTSTFTDGTISGTAIDASTFTNGQISGTAIDASTFTNGQISGSKIDSSILTNIPYAQIKDLDVTGDAIFRQSVVGDGTFYLDRLIVNSANIGTATIGELMVRDAQGKLHKVLIGTNGEVSSEEVKMDGQNLSNDAMMQVSQRLVWRQATQPSAPFIGMIWMDTSLTPAGKPKEILRRCTAITPSVVWEVVQSNELHTNVIDVDDNGMNILSGGNLNLLSGGAINIKNLSGTDNVINMDNTGLTISSTGQLNLQSTDSIIIGGSPFSVGGANYLPNSDFSQGVDVGWSAGGGLSGAYLFNGKKSLQLTSTTSRVEKARSLACPFNAGETFTVSVMVRTPYSSIYYANREKTVLYVRCSAADTTPLTDASASINPNWTGDWQKVKLTIEVPANTATILIRLYSNDYNGVASHLFFTNIQLEKGTQATDWSPAPSDPAGRVKTSSITIDNSGIDITSAGKLHLNAVDDITIGVGNSTLASSINLTANNSIKLAVSGGTNLLLNSDWSQGLQSGWDTTGPGFLDTNASYLYNGKIPLRLIVEAGFFERYSRQTVRVNTMDTNKFTLSFRYRVNSSNLALAGNSRAVSVYCQDSAGTAIAGGYFHVYHSELTGGTAWARKELSFTAPAGTEKIQVVMYNRSDGVSSNFIHLSDVQLEKGTQATDWSLAPSDPASGVKTSKIEIGSDFIDIESGGSVNISAGSDFNVRAGKQQKYLGISNNEANGYMLWAGSETPSTAPFSVTMDGTLKATTLDGAFVLGVDNGGTGEKVNRTHRGSTVPSDSFGQDGDLYVLFNGAVGVSWSDTNLTFGSNTQSTYFGVNRNWNQLQGGYRRIGNGMGTSSYDFGTYGYFDCPATTKTLNFKFTTTKYINGTSLSSGVTSYKVALASSLTGSILASTTVDASTSAIEREITLTTTSNLVQGTRYYLGIYYPDLTELNGAAISGNIVLKGSTSSTIGSALYVKTNGSWVRLAHA